MNKFRIHRRKLWAVVALIMTIIFVVAPAARAFEGRGGDMIVIEADEVIDDDLYVGAGAFTLEGTVKGDLVVAGSTITINGVVEGDLIAAGQSVIVKGSVGDDARLAGYAITVEGEIEDDALILGFSLNNEDTSSIGGDLLYRGYQVLLRGDVNEDADIAGGAIEIAGAIGGSAKVDVGGAESDEDLPPGFPFFPTLPTVPPVPAGLTVKESASIGGDLDYTANAKSDIPDGTVAGAIDFNEYIPEEPTAQTEQARRPMLLGLAGRWVVNRLRLLITWLLVGALMMWLVPDWTRKIADTVERKPLPSLGWGVVVIAAFAVAMLTLIIATILLALIFGVVTLGELAIHFVVLGGIITGSVGFSFGILWRYVTVVAVSLLLGQLLLRLFKPEAEHNRWWPMVLGVLILVLVTAVPVLGWLIKLIAVLLGLGAIWIWGRELLSSRQVISTGQEEQLSDVPSME